MTIKNLKYVAAIASLAMAASTSHAATVLGLTLDGANSDGGAFGTSAGDTLTDGFAYNPNTPIVPLPNQGSGSSVTGGFHADKTTGNHMLSYTLTGGALTTTIATATLYFDFYGRAANLNRDNNYTVTLYNGGYVTSIAQLTGQGVPDAAPYFNRSTFSLGTGVTFDRIQLTAPAGAVDADQYFTVMEVRAATDIIPEPSAALLGGLSMLGLLRRRRLS